MKKFTLTAAAALALAACNQTDAGNNAADANAADANAAAANEAAPADANASGDAKPADGAAPMDNPTAPAGDKPVDAGATEAASTNDAASGDKPQ